MTTIEGFARLGHICKKAPSLNPASSPTRDRSLPLQNVIPFVALFCLFASTAIAQTKWFKYEGNPVLDVGRVGSWEGAIVHTSRVILQDSVYRMWYSGFYGTRYWNLGYATSADGIVWTKHKANPVLRRGPRLWDGNGSHHAYIAHTNSNYEMWYNGGDASGDLRIGYATSQDGILWQKADTLNPVLDVGPIGSWHSRGVGRASVLGPDKRGEYKMWFGGNGSDPGVVKIGFATATNPTKWKKNADPVLTAGNPGAWDDYSVFFPRVLYSDGIYEMWYTGMRTPTTRRIGYATSLDGLHWTRNQENPVLLPGPEKSWDSHVVLVGDVLFDGQFYHMWYQGLYRGTDAAVGRMGYAISPKGMEFAISRRGASVHMPIDLNLRVENPRGMSFSAEIQSGDRTVLDLVELFDDGTHNDRVSGDGHFTNSWTPRGERLYLVDLKLKMASRKHASFKMSNGIAFATFGPVKVEAFESLGNVTPNPGDTLLIRLALRNDGTSTTANSVTASLSTPDSLVTCLGATQSEYGNIPPGTIILPPNYFRLLVNPECPPDTDVRVHVALASSGFSLWTDTFTFHVKAPWWQSTWAYVLYAVLLLGSIGGTARYVEIRKLRRRIGRLERERLLELERVRISQDMHDEVGARLTEIGILSELAKKDIEDPRKAEQQMQKISQASREVIANISEIIWALNMKNDSLDDLVAYLREYSSKYLGATAIKCTYDIPDGIPTFHLSTETRRNIFLVAKETLHNIVKHSRATDVQIRISLLSQNIEITISDNGRGFDAEQPSRFGNGLRNMEKRMNDIGGMFEIVSRAGNGTTVKARVKYQTTNS